MLALLPGRWQASLTLSMPQPIARHQDAIFSNFGYH